VISIQWNSEGSVIFDEIASKLYNAGEYGSPQRALGIFLDDSLLSAPQIRQQSYNRVTMVAARLRVTLPLMKLRSWLTC